MAYVETLLSSWQTILSNIAPIISVILIVLGGIVYGVAQTQPGEQRGKWQTAALAMLIGGIIVAAIAGAAVLIRDTSMKILT
ncbi:Uncharacterised protein [Candidatus Anstonella stagnisolia]|nr:Uncharacterised protein [Candidatus Anstonella stagnisolia]